MAEPAQPTVDSGGNIILGDIVCTDCGAKGNKYTALCDDCEGGL